MNILFLCRLYKPHVGGVEKHVEEISKILSKNHSLTIISERHDPKIPEYEKYPEAEVYRIPVFGVSEKNKKWVIWKWFFSNLSLIRKADIIHIHDVFFWILPFRLIFWFKRYFITFHGYEGSRPPGFKQIFWHHLGNFFCQANICIGDYLIKWYRLKATLVSYGAVNQPKTFIRPHKQLMYLGRLDLDTGIMDYLSAVKLLKVPIDIYGDGPLMPYVKSYIQKHHLKAKLLGFVPNAQKYISDYQVIFTSRYLGILEALAAKRPIVAQYDNPIKADCLKLAPFAKYIFICSDPKQIIQSYQQIQSASSQITGQVKSGYNWVQGQTWQKLSNQYLSLWQKISSKSA